MDDPVMYELMERLNQMDPGLMEQVFTGPCDRSEKCRDCVGQAFNRLYLKYLWLRSESVARELLGELAKCLKTTVG